MNPTDADEGTPVSVKIRERLLASRKRFYANDNIAPFIEPGELELLLDEVEDKMKGVLNSLVIDIEHDHNTDNTARRVAKMYVNEVFRTNVIGLSKYARLAEWIMGRPQIQEEAVVQLADLIQEKTQPDGLAIVMEASHYCMAWRGVKDMDSKMINSVMRGVFLKDPNLRREFLSLIPRKG